MLKVINRAVKYIQKRWGFDSYERIFIKIVNNIDNTKKNNNMQESRRILVQTPTDYFYLCLFFLVIQSLGGKRNYLAGLWHHNVMSAPREETFQGLRYLLRHIPNFLDKTKWRAFYRAFGVSHFTSLTVNPWQTFQHHRQADRIWRGLHNKKDLINLTLNNTPCGDLIYDTYLRYRVQATVDLSDKYLRTLIASALDAQAAFRKQLLEGQFDFFITSYSSYIQHGIPVREALRAGISVYSSGNLSQYFKKLTLDDHFHTAKHWGYKEKFNSCCDPVITRQISDAQLQVRFNGLRDAATLYMKDSAYSSNFHKMPIGIEAVVFLHDFFDSPHCYRSMLFVDFFEWVNFTLDIINSENLPIAVKPHPNQLPESELIVEQLKCKFPNVRWLDPKMSNATIFKSGIKCGVSVYGTILHELAYHGIPALAAGDHPHTDFDIATTPNTVEEYKYFLVNYDKIILSKIARNEVLDFYYMHNIFDKEDLKMDFSGLDFRSLEHSESTSLKKLLSAYYSKY